MGLLDALFDQNQYGDQTGGLLARLQPMLAPMQQGDGFPAPSPSFSDRFAALPNADAPAMATPMSVGNYQMPRLGSEAQYAAIPQNAQPAQGQMSQQGPQVAAPQRAEQSLPPAFGGTSLLSRIGNPDGLLARLSGNDSRSMAQQNLTAQFQALKQALVQQGMPENQAHSKAMLAVLNPKAGEIMIPQAFEKKKYSFAQAQDGSFVNQDPDTGKVSHAYGTPGAKFEDVASLRKEVGGLPEVKRYAEASPIFNSMIKSRDVNTAAADLDFVYGVAKIFDPESVVREGEMKLVGKAQSLPEDIKGMMGQVAMAKGRLTPEARQRILEVAQTRMSELRGAYDTRVNPYSDIAKRFNARPEDVLPSVPAMGDVAKGAPKSDALQIQEGATATNPKTGAKLTFRNGKWQ